MPQNEDMSKDQSRIRQKQTRFLKLTVNRIGEKYEKSIRSTKFIECNPLTLCNAAVKLQRSLDFHQRITIEQGTFHMTSAVNRRITNLELVADIFRGSGVSKKGNTKLSSE
ncbi:hypothetical protein HI914_06659 [Erysiphe necator]|nr:hypothetical protein HI914_06659 [Erysiphe necator]